MVTKVTNCKLELTIINKVLAGLDCPRLHIFAPSATDTEHRVVMEPVLVCRSSAVLTMLGCVAGSDA